VDRGGQWDSFARDDRNRETTKRWFTQAGTPTADFTQAQNQIREWKRWIANAANAALFREFYGLDSDDFDGLAFIPQYILVYGSISEFKDKPDLNEKRSFLEQRSDEGYRTFDSLKPNDNSQYLACVRIREKRKYELLTWPPVMKLSPWLAKDLLIWHGVEDAIRACVGISEERRQFLLNRVPYWRNWANSPDSDTYNTGTE
jgi:hypothetical protein